MSDPTLAVSYHLWRDTDDDDRLVWVAEGRAAWSGPPRPVTYGHGPTPEDALRDLREQERKAHDGK